jgi:hypothetical protein
VLRLKILIYPSSTNKSPTKKALSSISAGGSSLICHLIINKSLPRPAAMPFGFIEKILFPLNCWKNYITRPLNYHYELL